MRQDLSLHISRELGAVRSRRSGVTLGVWGEPSIGKTHFVDSLLSDLGCATHSIPVHRALRSLTLDLPRASGLPLAVQIQMKRIAGGESLGQRALVSVLVAQLSALAPFVLHLENLHEANAEDHGLVVLLAQAVKHSRGVGLLVTSHCEPPAPFKAYHLTPLNADEVATLLQTELKAPLPDQALTWIRTRTRGNPGVGLEFLRYLTRQGYLWSDGAQWHWREPPDDFVPASVEAFLLEMLSRVDAPGAQEVLDARAFLATDLGDATSGGLDHIWAQLSGLGPAAFGTARCRLEQSGYLRGQQFAHPLLGQVLSRQLSGERRQTLARRAVQAIHDPVAASRFLTPAGLPPQDSLTLLDRAVACAQAAGDDTLIAHLRAQSIPWLPVDQRAQVAFEAARTLYHIGAVEATRLTELSLHLAPEHREAAYQLAALHLAERRFVPCLEALESIAPDQRDTRRHWELMVQYHRAQLRPRQAMALWATRPELQAGADFAAVHQVVWALLDTGQLDAARALAQATLDRPDINAQHRGHFLSAQGVVAGWQGDLLAAERAFTLAHQASLEGGTTVRLFTYLFNRSEARFELGRYHDALDDLRAGMQAAHDRGSLVYEAASQARLGHLLVQRLEFEQAETLLLTSRKVIEDRQFLWLLCQVDGYLSALYLRWDTPHSGLLARRYADSALASARTNGIQKILLNQLLNSTEVELACGSALAARQLNDEASALAARLGMPAFQAWTLHQQAMINEALGEDELALDQYQEAQALFVRLNHPFRAHVAALAVGRLSSDWAGLEVLAQWFGAAGLLHLAQVARRHLPAQLVAALPPADIRLNVLGPLALERAGEPVVYRGRKRAELLAYMLEARLSGQAEANTLDLLEAVFPGDPEAEARHTLKQHIYLIRRSLGTASILSTHHGYALGTVRSDAEDFLEGGDSRLWRGPYLDGLTDGWLPGVREALVRALRVKIEDSLEQDTVEAARLARLLCVMEPYDAACLHLAVRALEATGEVQAATRLYSERRDALLEVGETLPRTHTAFMATGLAAD